MVYSVWLKGGGIVLDDDGKVIVCDECPCDDDSPCCGGSEVLGDELWATFESDHPCLDGKSVKLTRTSGNSWSGDHEEDAGGTMGVSLACNPANDAMTLMLWCNHAAGVQIPYDEEQSSCGPLQWVFENDAAWFTTWTGNCDCTGQGPLHVKVVITK